MTHPKWTAVALVLGLLVGMPVIAGAQAIDESNVAAKVAAATTAADHQALADYYSSQAAAAGAKVKTHEEMLASFQKGGGKPAASWATHCRSLIDTFKRQQKDYTAMAEDQAALAKSAK